MNTHIKCADQVFDCRLPAFLKFVICPVKCHCPLRLRFNSSIRVFASALFSVQMLLYMAIVVYAPSIALIQVK